MHRMCKSFWSLCFDVWSGRGEVALGEAQFLHLVPSRLGAILTGSGCGEV